MTTNGSGDLPEDFIAPREKSASPPAIDQALANTYIGKQIHVGLTYCNAAGETTRRIEVHGTIESASPSGIVILLQGENSGRSWTMPPELESIFAANPGKYTLHSTGEVVADPDLLNTWTITDPKQ